MTDREKKPEGSSSIVAKVRFTFAGPVTKTELNDALVRCFRTKQFRLVGRYEIVEMYEEVGLESAVTDEFVDVGKAYGKP